MAINLKYPLVKSTNGGFQTNDTTIEAITDDLALLITSNHGDRPIYFTYGANLRSIMFDPTEDVLTKAEDLVLSAVDEWMPFVEIVDIEARNSNTDRTLGENEIKIRVEFAVGQLKGNIDKTIKN